MNEPLRELERRWRETGAVEDEARYLAERLRTGRLSRERLALAASLGMTPRGGFTPATTGARSGS